MRTDPTQLFRQSCIALAIMSLSACATSDRSSGMESDSLYERVGQAGKRSMAMSANAWERTREALGIGRESSPDSLLDEVDLALMEEDAVLPPGTQPGTSAGRRVAPDSGSRYADASRRLPRTSIIAEPALAAAAGRQVPADAAPSAAVQSGSPQQREVTIVAANYDESRAADYLHEVSSDDTLWSIARRFTGDPGNWQQIADINDLPPDASVQAGQTLRIPGELLSGAPRQSVPASAPAIAMDSESEAAHTGSSRHPAAEVDPATQPVAVADTSFTVREGETLWDLARRATGDATLWKVIAEHNQFSEQETSRVFAGQEIRVPVELVTPEADVAAEADAQTPAAGAEAAAAEDQSANGAVETPLIDRSTGDEADTAVQADAAASTRQTAEPASQADAVVAERNTGAAESEPAASNESAAAMDVAAADVEPPRAADDPESILVSGTYYPKAVYNKADFSSSLLMRVSPGTALKVAGAQGPWFKVETDKGVGYMHARDIR